MKRFLAFVLLAILSLGCVAAAEKPHRITPEQNAKQSKRDAKHQQKMLRKANKKQAKAQRKYEKRQRKEIAKANKNLRKRRG